MEENNQKSYTLAIYKKNIDEAIRYFKDTSGLDIPFTYSGVTEKTTDKQVCGVYNGFDISFYVDVKTGVIWGEHAKKSGYLDITNITKQELDSVEPYDPKIESKLGFMKAERDYLDAQIRVIEQFKILPE